MNLNIYSLFKRKQPEKPVQLSMIEMVSSFHDKFDIEHPKRPSRLDADTQQFRINFMQEELDEYKKAVYEKNLEGALDALVDLIWVALGTALLHGFHKFDLAFRRVYSANMAKIKATQTSDSKRGYAGDIVKPLNWLPPNLKDLVE